MTPEADLEDELVVPEVPVQTDEGRRSLRVAFLRQRFPNGVQAHQFADMLYALEIVEELFPAVLRAVAARPPPPSPSLPPIKLKPAASPPATPEPSPLSKGAQALIKLIEDTPKISVEKLASELGYKQGYITQLVAEARRSGAPIKQEPDPRTKSPRYYMGRTQMRETHIPPPHPSIQ